MLRRALLTSSLIARTTAVALCCAATTVPALCDPPTPTPAPAPAAGAAEGFREVFPHVRVDVKARVVELDGSVPIVVDDPQAPDVYLELIACTPDTKEHEVLVVTPAQPSHVHAALLLIGLQPGAPGAWEWKGDTLTTIPPTGDPVAVDLVRTNAAGERIAEPAWSWIKNKKTGATFPKGDWVFAGSRRVVREGREWYDADGAGTLIGLCTFGGETIAWPKMISPESSVEEPVWVADAAKVPPFGTEVAIRLTPARPPAAPE